MMDSAELQTTDGGVRQGGPDLWCTYAAIRTLTALGARPQSPRASAAALAACRNPDGGYAWQKGLPSDVWATYYCTQALADLGIAIDDRDRLGAWLVGLQHESGGFAMTPGQAPDVWATYYATRTFRETLGRDVPREPELLAWLAALQCEDGGLAWYPGAAAEPDVRACYYGVHAWRACASDTEAQPPWHRERLIGWLRDRQWPAGGFAFDESSGQPCLWATFRAVRALAVLGAQPERPEACVGWIADRRIPGEGYHRWEERTSPDVWACFSAIGALQCLDAEAAARSREDTVRFLNSCELPEGGFTYRETPAAGDSLATAAALITESAAEPARAPGRRSGYVEWLRIAHMPYEGGVMYMPGRGAEVRCTLWAVSALSSVGERLAERDRLVEWFVRLQNKDGGFGYWHGRASDMVATVSALEALDRLGAPAAGTLDTDALGRFLDSCADSEGYRNTPSGEVGCASTAQAARALRLIGRTGGEAVAAGLDRYLTSLKGASARPRSLPDLGSTYQYHLAKQSFGLPVDLDALGGFVARLRIDEGYAWSPLSQRAGGPLAGCLATLLDRYSRSDGRFELPPLNL